MKTAAEQYLEHIDASFILHFMYTDAPSVAIRRRIFNQREQDAVRSLWNSTHNP